MSIEKKQTTGTTASEASTEAVKAPEQTTNTAATEVSTTAADASQTEQTPAQNGEDTTQTVEVEESTEEDTTVYAVFGNVAAGEIGIVDYPSMKDVSIPGGHYSILFLSESREECQAYMAKNFPDLD